MSWSYTLSARNAIAERLMREIGIPAQVKNTVEAVDPVEFVDSNDGQVVIFCCLAC
jgi:hypothetical protein